jgi:hypothetical protein
MKCPYSLKFGMIFGIVSCKAGARPYVPSLGEIETYCGSGRHLDCPLYKQQNCYARVSA